VQKAVCLIPDGSASSIASWNLNVGSILRLNFNSIVENCCSIGLRRHPGYLNKGAKWANPSSDGRHLIRRRWRNDSFPCWAGSISRFIEWPNSEHIRAAIIKTVIWIVHREIVHRDVWSC
jgi:hypothetical protein